MYRGMRPCLSSSLCHGAMTTKVCPTLRGGNASRCCVLQARFSVLRHSPADTPGKDGRRVLTDRLNSSWSLELR